MSPIVQELVEKHKKFLDSIVDDLPIGYLKRSILLEVNGIIESSPSLPILADNGSFGSDIEESTEWWKNIKKEIENLE